MNLAASCEKSYYSGWARVHDAKWDEDQARKAWLNSHCGLEPWPSLLGAGGPECAVCRRPYVPTRPAQQKVCGRCRSNGWTAATCECGRPLHRRDQTLVSRLAGRCGKCRREFLLETKPEAAAKVVVPEPPPPPLLCRICGGPKASRRGTKCEACGDRELCKCGNVTTTHTKKCRDCRRWETKP